MTLAAQAMERRLGARGMKILQVGENEGQIRWRAYKISFNGVEFAEMHVQSCTKTSKIVEIRVRQDGQLGRDMGTDRFPVFKCGGRMRRSPNIRKFGATVAKRLLPYGEAVCLEKAREIHDS